MRRGFSGLFFFVSNVLAVLELGLVRPKALLHDEDRLWVAIHEKEASPVRLGQRVRHGKFGDGVVLNSEGSGSHARVQVNFENAGTKWLVLAYAKLELL